MQLRQNPTVQNGLVARLHASRAKKLQSCCCRACLQLCPIKKADHLQRRDVLIQADLDLYVRASRSRMTARCSPPVWCPTLIVLWRAICCGILPLSRLAEPADISFIEIYLVIF